jgi:hypothetical protein
MITTDENELKAIKEAEHNAKLIVVSDWSQYTSVDYMDALKQTGYDILYEIAIPCVLSFFLSFNLRLVPIPRLTKLPAAAWIVC